MPLNPFEEGAVDRNVKYIPLPVDKQRNGRALRVRRLGPAAFKDKALHFG